MTACRVPNGHPFPTQPSCGPQCRLHSRKPKSRHLPSLCFPADTVTCQRQYLVKLVGGEVAHHGGGHLTTLAGTLWQVLGLMGPWLLTVTQHFQHLHRPRQNPGGEEKVPDMLVISQVTQDSVTPGAQWPACLLFVPSVGMCCVQHLSIALQNITKALC